MAGKSQQSDIGIHPRGGGQGFPHLWEMHLKPQGPKKRKNYRKTEKPKIQETLHKSGPGFMFMGFW